jgi:UDP-N-acetylmuramoyl-tripeptide--D-alanyl-D-alanine ligase
LLDLAAADTRLVANADDPLVMAQAARFAGRVITFGESERADVRAMQVVDRGFDGTESDVRTPAAAGRLSVPLAGRAQLSNVLAGIAVALELGVPWDAIVTRASQLRPVARRGAVTRLPDGVRLVDDSYNASPAAVRAMLAALGATATSGRRVAVLGEMLELGDATLWLHEDCGHAAAAVGVDELVVIGGPAADGLADGARAAGLGSSHIHRFTDSATAAPAVAKLVKPGDLVLVKGSRGTRTDLVADRLALGGEVA